MTYTAETLARIILEEIAGQVLFVEQQNLIKLQPLVLPNDLALKHAQQFIEQGIRFIATSTKRKDDISPLTLYIKEVYKRVTDFSHMCNELNH
jgi:hypothetical protein